MSLPRDIGQDGRFRLLWLIDSLQMGGAEKLVATYARAVDRGVLSFGVCCLKTIRGNPIERELIESGIDCTNLHARNLRDVPSFRRLVRLVEQGEFHLIHAHLTDASIWGSLAGWRTRVPVVASLHVFPSRETGLSRAAMRQRLMCAALNRLSAPVIAVSAALRDAYVRRGLIDSERMVVVHNGVDTVRFSPADAARRRAVRDALPFPADAPLLATTSVLRERRKGIHVLVDALPAILAAHPTTRLLAIGDGPLRAELEADARRKGIDWSIFWAGHRDDVAALLGAADLFVFPTLEEPFPTAVLEAMAAGLPVVASDVDGVPEMLDTPALGRLVGPGDPRALARAVCALLDDPAARRAAGMAARQRVCDRFSSRTWIDGLTRVYASAIHGGGAAVPSGGEARLQRR